MYKRQKWGKSLISSKIIPWQDLDANKTAGEEARRQLHRGVASNIEQVLAATPHNAPAIRPHASHRENYTS